MYFFNSFGLITALSIFIAFSAAHLDTTVLHHRLFAQYQPSTTAIQTNGLS